MFRCITLSINREVHSCLLVSSHSYCILIFQAQKEMEIDVSSYLPVTYKNRLGFNTILNAALILGFLWILYSASRRMGGAAGGAGGPFGAGKSTAKFFNKEVGIATKFKDVAGCEEAKVSSYWE